MSHVDDGILHAYLDGALDALSEAGALPDGATAADVVRHLETCPDCRARLEAERAIREGAGVVLGDAALPRVTVPPFAGSTAAPYTRRARWLPLGWAATVLLAVGAGWWGSAAWRGQNMPSMATDEGAARTTAEAAAAPSPQMQAMDAEDSARPDAGPGRPAAGQRGTAPGAAEESAAAPTAREPRLAGSPASAPVRGEPIGVTVRDRNDGTARQGADTMLAEAARVPPVRQAAGAGAVRAFQSGGISADVGHVTVPLTDADAQKQVLIPSPGPVAEFDSIDARERSGVLRFAEASPSDLRAVAGQLFVVADASPPTVEVAREIGRTIVRVRQTLASGESIELVSWRVAAVNLENVVATAPPQRRERGAVPQRSQHSAAAAEADTPDEPAAANLVRLAGVRKRSDGRHEVLVRGPAPDLWISVRADLDAADLQALASQLVRPVLP